MRRPATPRLIVRRRTGATAIAGKSRTESGWRYRRTCRGEDVGFTSSSWPGSSRPSTTYFQPARTWMPGTSPGMTSPSAIKHDHAAQRLAGLHVGKAFVDLGELQLGRNPVFQMQLAAQVEFDQAGHVDAEMI